MDSRVELLEQFYKTMCRDKVKLESKIFGFQFIDRLTADHEILDYIQMENHYIHKYRLLHISESRRKILLEGHVNKNYNICLYFDEVANNVLCFNLDNNFRQNNNAIIPELAVAAVHLEKQLAYFGMETLTLKSGRGYHQWCRFEQPIDNRLLFGFMVRIAAKTLAALHGENYDYHSIKINMNPNPRFVKNISLRAFGSQHIRTGSFSYVQAQAGILNETDSWRYFQEYMVHKTISQAKFIAAYDELAADISL